MNSNSIDLDPNKIITNYMALDSYKELDKCIGDYTVNILVESHPNKTAYAFYNTGYDENFQVSQLDIIINSAHDQSDLYTNIDHEYIHACQGVMEAKVRLAEGLIKHYNPKTLIAYDLLREAHAFTYSSELLFKRYMLQGQKSENEKRFNPLYSGNTDDFAYFMFTAYCIGVSGMDYQYFSEKESAIETIQKTTKGLSKKELSDRFQIGREVAFANFFEPQQDEEGRCYNGPGLSWYLEQGFRTAEHIINSYKDMGKHNLGLNTECAVKALLIENKPFISSKTINAFLDISDISEITDYLVKISTEKDDYQRRLKSLNCSQRL